jgi:regulator of cell morphogenesis and NO signaling
MPNPACSFDDPRIDESCTVNEVLLRHPESMKVFNAFGIDSCCGGAATLRDAARDSGLLPETLVFALESVVRHDAQLPQEQGR